MPSAAVLTVWACVLVDQEEPAIAGDAADLTHQVQFRRGEEVVQRQADPCDIHALGPIARRRDEIAMVEADRTVKRLKSIARQIQRRVREVDPMIVRYPRS